MLARVNRVTRPSEFRAVARRGHKVGAGNTVLQVLSSDDGFAPRFGFIVTKSVGGAVTRNLVRRRLRAACREILPSVSVGTVVVIRALPGSDQAAWVTLQTEIAEGIGTSMISSLAGAQ